MTEFFKRSWQWRASLVKGALYVFVAMASVVVSTFQGWDDTYVSQMRWWNWATLWLSALVAGSNSCISFIDKSFHDKSAELKDKPL